MKPSALQVRPDGIPNLLKIESRWVCWRYEQRRGEDRWAKILCDVTGRHAKANDASTWTTFDNVMSTYRSGRFEGVGFCLGDGWSGIDLDHVPADADQLRRLRALGVYLERSPSGKGYKALGRGPRIGGEINFESAAGRNPTTVWQGGRFFAITGHGEGDPTVDLTALVVEWFPLEPTARRLSASAPAYIKKGTQGHESLSAPRSDDEVLLSAATAINKDKFLRLFRGDRSGYGDDKSRADQALLSILAYWCNGDRDQIDRLFRQSGLMRDKWHVRSYREATLNKAIALSMIGGGV